MGAPKVICALFNSEKMGTVNNFLYQKLILFVHSFLFSVSAYILPLFAFISTNAFRFKSNDYSTEIENNKKDSNLDESEVDWSAKEDDVYFADSEREKETPDFSFKFKFPSYEELSKNRGKENSSTDDRYVEFMSGESFSGVIDGFSNVNTETTNEFIYGKSFSGVIDEFSDEITDSNCGFEDNDSVYNGFLSGSTEVWSEAESVLEETPENGVSGENVAEKIYPNTIRKTENISHETEFPSEMESSNSNHLNSVMSRFVDSYGVGFLSDGDFGGGFELDTEESHLQNEEEFNTNFLSEKDFPGNGGKDDYKAMNGSENSEETNKLETLWEHQELIEQLKMEIRKVRATGLPTILEESESPKMMEDLKPWKIEEKLQNENPMGELQKFYKSYRDRMRKFDIFNYQKMYAIGFLQLKDPAQSISTQKSSIPEIGSLFPQTFYPSKHKKKESDPTMKFIKEVQNDLEVVYVGQMCLSWEILHWQYGMALDLWESDPRGVRRFNEVAGEFQQFQVLMQRFIEDEAFHGPRVQNYVKNRCVLRNLLQVPVIREDSSKDKKKARLREGGEYGITSDMLVEIMEESIRIFWRFIRADTNCSIVTVNGRKGTPVELQDPADSGLLMEVLKNLQKKERKLKYLLRSGNCILRRFQKNQEDSNSDQVLYFFSQVDMKLVWRVLNMPRITTDQLVWCRNKLSKISFVDRKIHVEPSFLLFPC